MDSETMKIVDRAALEFDEAFQNYDFQSTVYGIVNGSKPILNFLYSVSRYERVSHWYLKAALWMLLMMIKRLRHQNYRLVSPGVKLAAEQDEACRVYKISTSFTSEILIHADDTVLNKVLDETLQQHKRLIMEHAAQLKSLQENNGE